WSYRCARPPGARAWTRARCSGSFEGYRRAAAATRSAPRARESPPRRACSPTCSASISGSRRSRARAPRSCRSCPYLSWRPPSEYYCPVIVANPRPAATVVVLRDSSAGPEVFWVRRHADTAFMGGAHVFPGGRVDAADREGNGEWCDGIPHAEAQLNALPGAEAVAYHVAAARELIEEAGVLLARDASGAFVSLAGADDHARFKRARHDVHGGKTTLRAVVARERLQLALDTLVLVSHWVTLPIDTRMPLAFEQHGRRFLLLPGDPLHPDPAGDELPVETRFVLVEKRWRPERART